MTQEELLAELRKTKKAGAELLKENMKRKEKERIGRSACSVR